jgi:CHAD domain-containing protein
MSEATTFVEREHKLDVDATFELPNVQAMLGDALNATPRRPTVLEATYYDTADLVLFRAGVAIRRRTGGHDAGWHLKLYEGVPGERTEVQLPLSRGDNAVPAELTRELPSGLPHKLDLRPVLRLRTERTVTELSDGAGSQVGELADDRVVAARLDDGRVTHWRELEIEAMGADTAAALATLEQMLIESGARPASHDSKLARGLGVDPDREWPLPAPESLDPLSLRLRAQFVELISCEADVREGRDDGVHEMRVAVRRLRSCLRTFRPAFEESAARRIGGQLKWLGDLLGAERDAEVIAARMQADLGELAGTDILGPVELDLGVRSHDEIVMAHARLMQAIESDLYRSLLEELAELVPESSSRLPSDQRWLRHRVGMSAQHTIRLIVRADSVESSARATALHEVRKSAKHVRYAAETLAPIEHKRAKALAAQFEALQEVLGEHHDAIVTQHRFRIEGARAGVRPGENGFTYGALFALEAERARTAEAKVDSFEKRARREAKWWLDR